MKDFHDIRYLTSRFAFVSDVLQKAIRATFDCRSTPVPVSAALPVALTDALWNDPNKHSQWKAFLRRSRLVNEPTLESVIREIRMFIVPILDGIERADQRERRWPAGGPWR